MTSSFWPWQPTKQNTPKKLKVWKLGCDDMKIKKKWRITHLGSVPWMGPGVLILLVWQKKKILRVLKIIPEWEPFLNCGHSANCFISYLWKQYQWWWFSCQVVLVTSMDYSPPSSSVYGISQARILEWATISFSRGSSWLRDRTCISCLVGGFFSTEPPGKPPVT